MKERRSQRHRACRRPGTALVMVLVVVAALSWAAYQFADNMTTHAIYLRTDHSHAQQRLLARSAAESLIVELTTTSKPGRQSHRVRESKFPTASSNRSLSNNPDSFAAYSYRTSNEPWNVEPGLADESAKLNLNALPLAKHQQSVARAALMQLPGMNVATADCILDWLDEDDDVRPLGAESNYYTSLSPPYEAANCRLRTIHELLLVRGVTRDLLYGASKDDGRKTFSASGLADGWSRFLTVDSRERNVDCFGHKRIDLNHHDLAVLFDQLLPRFGSDKARFVVALRLAGPWSDGQVRLPARSREDARAEAELRVQSQLHATPDVEASQVRGPITRAGIDLRSRPTFRLRSLVDLWATQVRISVKDEDELLVSPWGNTTVDLERLFDECGDELTTSASATVEGRINVNLAPREVLQMIPGIDAELAQAITRRQRDLDGRLRDDPSRRSLAWLLDEDLLTPGMLREIAPFLTCRGDIHHGFIACRKDKTSPAMHFSVVIDNSRVPAELRCLEPLGPLPSVVSDKLHAYWRHP